MRALIMARLVGTSDGTVGGIAEYRTLFQAAFPGAATYDELTFAHAARAIAAFEASTWTFFDAPLDRYLGGCSSGGRTVQRSQRAAGRLIRTFRRLGATRLQPPFGREP